MNKTRIPVPVDEKLAALVWQVYGPAIAFEATGGDKPVSTLPGFLLARALIEKELAEMRAQMAGAVYRAAAKAGHDVSMVASIGTNIKDCRPYVEIEPLDLVGRAEA